MSQDLQSELHAIREGAAYATLSDRALLRVTGSDATRWLNGMVTNSIQALQPGEGSYNFLLNAQGRIQADCTIYRESHSEEPTFLLETDNSQLETVRETLDRYIIMDDVELHPVELTGLVVMGARAFHALAQLSLGDNEEVLAAAAASPAGMLRAKMLGRDALTLVPPAAPVSTYEIWFPAESHVADLSERLRNVGGVQVSCEALEAFRILSGIPRYGVDIRDRDLPQETSQAHALHFAKGCYLGQEIVERIRSRGQVHRLFAAFQLEGELPSLPSPLEANSKPAGELTSAVKVGDSIFALGYARREALDTLAEFTYSGGRAYPRKPGTETTDFPASSTASNLS